MRSDSSLVEATGLEPAASWSQTKHSTKLSYASMLRGSKQLLYYIGFWAFCQYMPVSSIPAYRMHLRQNTEYAMLISKPYPLIPGFAPSKNDFDIIRQTEYNEEDDSTG